MDILENVTARNKLQTTMISEPKSFYQEKCLKDEL